MGMLHLRRLHQDRAAAPAPEPEPDAPALPPPPSFAATSVKVVEFGVAELATDQAALGGSCRVSLAGGGLSISPMASTPM